VTRLIEEGALDSRRYSRMRIHAIKDDRIMETLGVASKLDPDWGFLCTLRDAGRRAAAAWLDAAYGDIAHKSSIDLTEVYL
jgi:NTE family protein